MSIHKDVASGIVILIVCAALYYVTTGFDTDPLGLAQGMPATHMPRLVLATISLLAVIIIVQGLRADTQEASAPIPWQMWATAAPLALAALCFTTVGVPLTFFAVCIALPLLWGSRNYIAIAVFAPTVPVAIYIVFQMLLGVRLPLGPLDAFVL